MKKLTLSAVLIVKNEEEILVNALESVKDFDEIIVVDTGSTDKTIEIAQKYTNKIHHFPWIDDFSAARNHAIKQATGDWIYSIDADQILLSPVKLVREEAERAEKWGHKTALVKTKTSNGHEHWREVLFKRDKDVFWKGAYHESISIPSTFKSKIERHRGASKSKLADPERGLRILQKQEKTPRVKFYLAREYYERAKYDDALFWMNDYLANKPTWPPEIAEAWLVKARCHWQLQQGDDAREACLQAIKVNPDFKEALLFMGAMHYEPWKSKWNKLAAVATNQDVLFIRT